MSENCSLAAENMMLVAHSLGLGTCWIGFAQGYLNTREGKELLGLPIAAVPVAPAHRWASEVYSVRRGAKGPGRAPDWLIAPLML